MACLAALVGAAVQAGAGEATAGQVTPPRSFEAFEQGDFTVDLRYRYEFVDDAAFEKDAHASTLRSALTFETAPYRGFFGGLVLENVTAIGNDELYDNLGAGRLSNGVTDRPVVADPALTEVDRAYLGYRGPLGLELRVGRIDYVLDNQRFVGIAPWRQSYRSYDAVSAALGRPDGWRARYAYLDRVNYNNGSRPALDGHLFHVSRRLGIGAFSAYAYLLDWGSEERAALSSGTFGARLQGNRKVGSTDVLYLAEYARQVDHGDNPRGVLPGLRPPRVGGPKRRLDPAGRVGAQGRRRHQRRPDPARHQPRQERLRRPAGGNPPDGSQDRYVRLSMDRKDLGVARSPTMISRRREAGPTSGGSWTSRPATPSPRRSPSTSSWPGTGRTRSPGTPPRSCSGRPGAWTSSDRRRTRRDAPGGSDRKLPAGAVGVRQELVGLGGVRRLILGASHCSRWPVRSATFPSRVSSHSGAP